MNGSRVGTTGATHHDGQPAVDEAAKARFAAGDVLKMLAAMAAVGAVFLHLIGVATHDAYLREWGVEIELFPKPIDRVLIEGYEGLLVAALKLWPQVLENTVYLVGFALLIGAYWTLWHVLDRWTDDMEVAPGWLLRRPQWLRDLVPRFFLILLTLVVVPIAVWLASLLSALPLVLAESNGKAHAKAEQAQFFKGCEAATVTRCFEIRRGSESLGRGLLIDSSTDYIAFFDVATSRVRVLPRKDTEMVNSPSR